MPSSQKKLYWWYFLSPIWLPHWLAYAVLLLIVLLPHTVQWYIAGKLSRILSRIAKKRNTIISKNIAFCFPEKSAAEQDALVRANWHNTAFMLFETIGAWHIASRYSKRLHVKNIHFVDEATQQGKGIIFLGAHFTNMELIGAILNENIPMTINYRKGNSPFPEWVSTRARQRVFPNIIAKGNLISIVRILLKGDRLWYAPDQFYQRKMSTTTTFFNHENVATVAATTAIAKAGKATVLPVKFYRVGSEYTLEILPPWDNYPSGDDQQDAQRYMSHLEQWIREYPDQYIWAHRRFKHHIKY